MGLKDIGEKIAAQRAETFEDVQARVEATVGGSSEDIVEIDVPHEHSAALLAWVESHGVRCGCVIEPGRRARLVINTKLAPPPRKSAEQIQAEIDAAVARTIEAQDLAARVKAIEDELAQTRELPALGGR